MSSTKLPQAKDDLLHYAPRLDDTEPALCGTPAPEGGWFGPKNRELTRQFFEEEKPVCFCCLKLFEQLPAWSFQENHGQD